MRGKHARGGHARGERARGGRVDAKVVLSQDSPWTEGQGQGLAGGRKGCGGYSAGADWRLRDWGWGWGGGMGGNTNTFGVEIFYCVFRTCSWSLVQSHGSSGGAAEDRVHVLSGTAQLDAHADLGDAVAQREQAVEEREGFRAYAGAGEQDHAEGDGYRAA